MLSLSVVETTVETLLGRVGNESDRLNELRASASLEAAIRTIVSRPEFIQRAAARIAGGEGERADPDWAHPGGGTHLSPAALRMSTARAAKILFVGQCLIEDWAKTLNAMDLGCTGEHVLFNNAAVLPDIPEGKIGDFLFQVVQLPLRSVVRDGRALNVDHSSPDACRVLFRHASEQIPPLVEAIMQYNTQHGLQTFYCNFLAPQANLMGRLLPRYAENNTLHFYSKLNEELSRAFSRFSNAHLLDIDNVSNVLGKRYFQDDTAWITSHGGLLNDFDHRRDQNRLEPTRRMSEHYELDTRCFIETCLHEAFAMYRTLAQIDSVKLVVTDLDDILWRGILGDHGAENLHIEGWPVGYIEALNVLRRRGILLGIVSKNTQELVEKGWNVATRGFIKLNDFAITRINWENKVKNMSEILAVVNLLPRNVVYIDDNPVERAAMAAAFPEMRILGSTPYLLRRDLLWSAETQVASVTTESARRTQMMQAQVEREATRKTLSKEEFLATLGVHVSMGQVASTDAPHFGRCFELLNKTNQFNTTGIRWTMQDCTGLFSESGRFVHFSVRDAYTEYGLVGLLVVRGAEIAQFVMSCRVVGLDVEKAALAFVLDSLREEGRPSALARFVRTDANTLCQDLYGDAGFRQVDDRLSRSLDAPAAVPSHVLVEVGVDG